MPKQNIGRKGLSEKPNKNAADSFDEATDPVNAEEIAPTNPETSRVVDAPENQAATERPKPEHSKTQRSGK